MFKVHIHNAAFGTLGSFVAASEHKLLNTYPVSIDGTDNALYSLDWGIGKEVLKLGLQRKKAMEYIDWLAKVRRLAADCENRKFVFTTNDWRFDLAGIDTRNYDIVKPDAKLRTQYHSFIVYKGGVAVTKMLRSDEEAEAFLALFNEYMRRIDDINDGHFRFFEE